MEGTGPLRRVKLKDRLGFQTRRMRWIYRALFPFFHCGVKIPEEMRESEEPVVFIANHYNVFGPLGFMVSMPLNVNIWMSEQMVNPEEARKTMVPGMQKILPFLKGSRVEWICARVASFIVWVLTGLGMIPVDRRNPSRLISTMRKSIASLEEGHNLLIFPETGYPEYSLTSVTPFFSGFATLGQLYYRKTGKSLRFCPCYIDEQHRRIRLGEMTAWNPEADPKEETVRVSDELNLRMREMAAENRGMIPDRRFFSRRRALRWCNLARVLLLILLIPGVMAESRLTPMIYLASQGFRLLFRFFSRVMHASNQASVLMCQGIGILTDLCFLSYLDLGAFQTGWLLFALLLQAAMILGSNLISYARHRRCAGMNFYDSLAADLFFLVCALNLPGVRERVPWLREPALLCLIFVLFSILATRAFNARIGKETGWDLPEEAAFAAVAKQRPE